MTPQEQASQGHKPQVRQSVTETPRPDVPDNTLRFSHLQTLATALANIFSLELDPTLAAQYGKGVRQFRRGKYDAAIDSFDKALKIDHKFQYAHMGKGNAMSKAGDLKGAVECYDAALKLDPKRIDAHNNMGVSLDKMGRHVEALECFDAALEMRQDAGTYNNKGVVLRNDTQYFPASDDDTSRMKRSV